MLAVARNDARACHAGGSFETDVLGLAPPASVTMAGQPVRPVGVANTEPPQLPRWRQQGLIVVRRPTSDLPWKLLPEVGAAHGSGCSKNGALVDFVKTFEVPEQPERNRPACSVLTPVVGFRTAQRAGCARRGIPGVAALCVRRVWFGKGNDLFCRGAAPVPRIIERVALEIAGENLLDVLRHQLDYRQLSNVQVELQPFDASLLRGRLRRR